MSQITPSPLPNRFDVLIDQQNGAPYTVGYANGLAGSFDYYLIVFPGLLPQTQQAKV